MLPRHSPRHLVTHGETVCKPAMCRWLLHCEQGEYGTLYGHLARANRKGRTGATGRAMLTFGRAGCLSAGLSPSKANGKVVPPGMIHCQVHARPRPRPSATAGRLVDIAAPHDRHEAGRHSLGPCPTRPPYYIDSMLKAIVGVRHSHRRLGRQAQASQTPQRRRHQRRARRAGPASPENQ